MMIIQEKSYRSRWIYSGMKNTTTNDPIVVSKAASMAKNAFRLW